MDKFEFDEEIVKLTMRLKMKLRTMVNFFHMFIAMKEDAYLLTGDKELISTVKDNKLYDKILSYVELRAMFI